MNLSLDDIIQQNRRRGRGRGRARGNGFLRGVRRGGVNRRSSGGGTRLLPDKWQHDMYPGTRSQNTSTSNKLHISNLDFGVTNDDINELFREFGVIRKATIHYDRSGRPLGTAEVTFANSASATKARNRYNGVPLDGRPMVIQLVGAGDAGPMSENSGRGRLGPVASRITPKRRFTVTRGRGMRGGRGRGRGRRPQVSKEELDAELAAYNAKRA